MLRRTAFVYVTLSVKHAEPKARFSVYRPTVHMCLIVHVHRTEIDEGSKSPKYYSVVSRVLAER
jgi:hypothetical protein